MVISVTVPRINNNEDLVRVVSVCQEVGAEVKCGDAVAEVESDKANVTVEATQDGRILGIAGQPGSMMKVGSTLLWLGTAAEDTVPHAAEEPPAATPTTGSVTAKARELLVQYGLSAEEVPRAGPRLTVQDIEQHLKRQNPELSDGEPQELSLAERGMLRNVLWHQREAVPAYLEYSYEDGAWLQFARDFADRHRLLFDPLIGLMLHQLSWIARKSPRLNSTLVDEKRWQYHSVHVGFTVQVERTLYLAVVREAGAMSRLDCVNRVVELHRNAIEHKLAQHEVCGATVGFTSMARWRVTRHIPILPRGVSLMVAHSAADRGSAVLGATYDHRVLTGLDVASALKVLSQPLADDKVSSL